MTTLRQPQLIAEASDMETSTARLDELASEQFLAVKRRVASHPNASAEALVAVFNAAPDEVLQNPAWMLHLIADPSLYDQLKAEDLVKIANWHRCPATFVRWACRRGDDVVLWRLVLNPHLDGEQRARAACHLSDEQGDTLGEIHLSGLVPVALSWLWRLVKETEPAPTADDLKALIAWGPLGIRRVLAWSETPSSVLEVLAHHPLESIRLQVVAHAQADEPVLTALASDTLDSVRKAAGKALKALKPARKGPVKPRKPAPTKKKTVSQSAEKGQTTTPMSEAPPEDEAPAPRRRSFGLLSPRRSRSDD
ncbi:MAG: hypothetical protein ACE366_18775 [Bradymonadia bacterium]